MALPDLSDFEAFASEQLRVRWAGKEYVLPPVGIADGLLLQRAAAGDVAALAEWNEGDRSYRIFLGKTYDQMLADNVPIAFVDRAHLTALAQFKHGPIAAAKVWETGQDPEALASLAEAILRMTLSDKAGAEENTTPRPASGSSTTSPRSTRSAPRKRKADSSAGSKSALTGG